MKKITPFWVTAASLVVVFVILFLYTPVAFILNKAFFPIDNFSLEFFSLIFSNSLIVNSLLTTFVLGLIVTVGSVVISLPLAWYSTRYKLKFHSLLQGLLLLPMILPPFVGAIGMKQFLSRFGTLNLLLMDLHLIDKPIDWLGSGFWGVVILEILHLFPIVYLNLAAVLANIDPTLEEAAWNLGSSKIKFFKRIIIPLTAPGLFAGCAIVFLWSVTDLGTPLILEYRNVVAYQIYSMVNDIHENPMGYALVLIVLAWVMLFYFGSKILFLSQSNFASMRGSRTVNKTIMSIPKQLMVSSLFLLVGFIALIPHFMVVLSSISERWFMTLVPEKFSFENFHTLYENSMTYISVKNSIFLSSVTTMLDILLGLIAAYVLTRFKFFGRKFLDFSVMLPLALPGLILAFGYVGTFAGTMLDPRDNPIILLITAYSVRRLPFMVRSLDAGLRQIHPSLEEASYNLGAGPIRSLSKIILPLLIPNIIAGGILVFSFAMLEVSDSLILAMKESYYPITKAIYAFVNRIGDGLAVAASMGVITMIVLGVSLLVASKILGKKMGDLFRM